MQTLAKAHIRELAVEQPAAIRQFAQRLQEGEHWYRALLGCIPLWHLQEEYFAGRHFKYMLAGEALDLLLLAERITWDFRHLLPRKELEELLLAGVPPLALSEAQFAGLLGVEYHRAYLNFFYGVVLEEVIIYTLEQEILKETDYGATRDPRDGDSPYLRLYGRTEEELWSSFCAENGRSLRSATTMTEWKEFLYWLFKQRVAWSLPDRLASDTKKGLDTLRHLRKLCPGGPFDVLRA